MRPGAPARRARSAARRSGGRARRGGTRRQARVARELELLALYSLAYLPEDGRREPGGAICLEPPATSRGGEADAGAALGKGRDPPDRGVAARAGGSGSAPQH